MGGKKWDKAEMRNSTVNYTSFAQNTASLFTAVVPLQSSLYTLTRMYLLSGVYNTEQNNFEILGVKLTNTQIIKEESFFDNKNKTFT